MNTDAHDGMDVVPYDGFGVVCDVFYNDSTVILRNEAFGLVFPSDTVAVSKPGDLSCHIDEHDFT